MTDIEIITRLDDIEKRIVELVAENAELLTALKEISNGAGAYSKDPLRHAENVIENLKAIARIAIEKAEKI